MQFCIYWYKCIYWKIVLCCLDNLRCLLHNCSSHNVPTSRTTIFSTVLYCFSILSFTCKCLTERSHITKFGPIFSTKSLRFVIQSIMGEGPIWPKILFSHTKKITDQNYHVWISGWISVRVNTPWALFCYKFSTELCVLKWMTLTSGQACPVFPLTAIVCTPL